MSRHLDSSTTTQMAKIMVHYGRPSPFFLSEVCVWSSFGKTVMGEAIWENPIEVWLGEGFQLRMLIRTPWKRVILICVCGWHQIGWKETTRCSMWKVLNKEVDLGEPTSFLGLGNLGCTQRHCEISKDIVDNYRAMFTMKIFVFLRGPTIWKVMPRNVWNDIVSWLTRRRNNSTRYLLPASMTTTSKKKKQNLLDNCQKYLLKLVWNACTWHVLEDLIFYGQWTNLHDRLQNGPRLVTNA